MQPFEYALGLISILMSLALADIVISFHKLMRQRRTITWDGRLLVAALLVVLEVVRIWFAQWAIRDVQVALSFPIYMVLFAQILLLVLTAAACLPDEVGEDCDLSVFYESNRDYFWGVFAASQTGYFSLWLIFGGGESTVGGTGALIDWARILGPLAAYIALAKIRIKLLDYALPILIIVFYLVRYWPQTIAA